MKDSWEGSVLCAFERLPALAASRHIAVAVSGGGDSMALLSLLARWSRSQDTRLTSVTVDHGIRPQAKEECALAAGFARQLGIGHRRLEWSPSASGNLQDAARRARYRLIADWAVSEQIEVAALAHTMDDQAETFLMNLARGSGVDGLSAMPAEIERHGIRWLRPLLGVSRSDLRDYLRRSDIEWADDPGNDDCSFDRVKARRLIGMMAPLGLTAARLAATALRMQDARRVLEGAADDAVSECASLNQRGEIIFSRQFWLLPEDIRMRISADALRAVSGSEYRPRFKSLAAALEKSRNCAVTLSGCVIKPAGEGGLAVFREMAACGPAVPADGIWDGRWRLARPGPPEGAVIAALGPSAATDGRLAATPALWLDGEVWAAPFAGLRPDWSFELCRNGPHWRRFAVTSSDVLTSLI